uniref:Enolase-phosphatase E1 n=1 Tax=Ditylum brightwellii TaxID=49249 RepID=A0A6U3Y0D7_9STRA|mmetsp:Transcript_4668/g.7151  ORF Transcript_4668/g.7151 Transcript_4668/m.7151 type:complete len:306 (+) Transcript_4668:173-1090(+)
MSEPTTTTDQEEQKEVEEPITKKRKIEDASNGFNAATDINNASDLTENTTPLLPRDCKTLLLDIEGCTTAISFVHDVLFPFARNNVTKYLEGLAEESDKTTIADALVEDVKKLEEDHPSRKELAEKKVEDMSSVEEKIVSHVHALMNHDVKATGLKGLQGKIWKAGYASGELKGHIYDDFKPLLEWCKAHDVKVCIYSSGSIGAQKLLFGHSDAGDLCDYFTSHYDTTSGGKKESKSYETIAKDIGLDVKEICFVSDAEEELVAAREAGIGYVVMSVRAGNKPLTGVGREFPIVYSLLQLCGSGK